uniref:Jun dimerization protein 2 n=1 Tax=Molossus molossus TaxID=27622 RepID=A0A7J8JUG9_MOLMO|nr:Jun dimerization protein 2 [Molossus molossus]
MMPGQIPDPSVTAGSLPGLGPLTGLPSSALTAEELKYADIRNIGAMIAPLHFLEVKLGKRPQPVKSERYSEWGPQTSGTASGNMLDVQILGSHPKRLKQTP